MICAQGSEDRSARKTLVLADCEFAELSAEILENGASMRFRARGSSMSPFVREGDIVTVAPIEPEALLRGDVVLYRSSATRVLAHRILGRGRRGTLLIRGDANRGKCERVRPETVVGVIVEIHRGRRKLRSRSLARRSAGLVWAMTPSRIRGILLRIGRGQAW